MSPSARRSLFFLRWQLLSWELGKCLAALGPLSWNSSVFSGSLGGGSGSVSWPVGLLGHQDFGNLNIGLADQSGLQGVEPSVRVGWAGVMRRGPQTCLPLPSHQAAPESQISQRLVCWMTEISLDVVLLSFPDSELDPGLGVLGWKPADPLSGRALTYLALLVTCWTPREVPRL